MTPEQLRAEIAQDDATLEEIQRVTETYQHNTPKESNYDSSAICPNPQSCAADQVCIYRCHWVGTWAARKSYEHQKAISDAAVSCYQRHTVEITGPAPQYVEDELLAFELAWRKWAARVAWGVMLVFVVGYVVWRWVSGVQ